MTDREDLLVGHETASNAALPGAEALPPDNPSLPGARASASGATSGGSSQPSRRHGGAGPVRGHRSVRQHRAADLDHRPDLCRLPRPQSGGFTVTHPLGTDQLGRDILSRMMTGGRVSISVGLVAMSIALTLGSFIGILSGYFRRLDAPLMRLTELFLALPLLPLLLLMVTLFREPLGRTLGPAGARSC